MFHEIRCGADVGGRSCRHNAQWVDSLDMFYRCTLHRNKAVHQTALKGTRWRRLITTVRQATCVSSNWQSKP